MVRVNANYLETITIGCVLLVRLFRAFPLLIKKDLVKRVQFLRSKPRTSTRPKKEGRTKCASSKRMLLPEMLEIIEHITFNTTAPKQILLHQFSTTIKPQMDVQRCNCYARNNQTKRTHQISWLKRMNQEMSRSIAQTSSTA